MKNCSLTGGETNGSNMQNKKTETKQNRLGRSTDSFSERATARDLRVYKDDNPCE